MKTKNLTISLDEDLLRASKRYAKLRGSSINELFRDFLRDKLVGESNSNIVEELLSAFDEAEGDSKGKRWKREDAYSR